MKMIKVHVRNEAESIAVQEWMFSKGYFWNSSYNNTRNTRMPFLYGDANGQISYSNVSEWNEDNPRNDPFFDNQTEYTELHFDFAPAKLVAVPRQTFVTVDGKEMTVEEAKQYLETLN